MQDAGVRRTAHEITVAVPAATVHRLIADVDNWPRTFPDTVHVALEAAPEGEQRLRIWEAADGGEPQVRTLRRIVQDDELRVNFEQLTNEPPVASLGGAWLVEPAGEDSSRVRLLHEFRAAAEGAAADAVLDAIAVRVGREAQDTLAALKENVEAVHATEDVTFSFEDTVHIDGSA
ncbi:aromatase/cyclase, partial [Streptomyces sp. NPDC002073]